MNRYITQVVISYLLTGLFSCLGQDGKAITQPIEPLIPFEENWTDEIPHSGGIRIGLMSHYDVNEINPSSFSVLIPEGKFTTLCCDIKSRDGRYSASLQYDITKLVPDSVYTFKLPTKYHSKLEYYQSKDIVILAAVGNNCNNDLKYYVPASWDSTKAIQGAITDADTVYILLLSEADITYLEVYNTKTSESIHCDCSKIDANTSRAYNSLCKIPLSIIDQYSKMEVVQKEITPYDEKNYHYKFTFKVK